jgi:hypothetical protein
MANALSKVQGLPYFNDLFGNALDVGNVYIGLPNTDPRQNPMTVYFDEAQTIPAPQPIRVLEGRLTKTGSVSEIFVNPPYSIYVEDQRGAQVYYLPSVDDPVVSAIGTLSVTVQPNIAALRLLNPLTAANALVMSYYSAAGKPDGGGGIYKYDSTDTTTPDNAGSVIVGLNNARWKLYQPNGRVSVKQFGAKGDGATLDDAAFAAAIGAAATGPTLNGQTISEVYIPASHYKLAHALNVTGFSFAGRSLSLIGDGWNHDTNLFGSVIEVNSGAGNWIADFTGSQFVTVKNIKFVSPGPSAATNGLLFARQTPQTSGPTYAQNNILDTVCVIVATNNGSIALGNNCAEQFTVRNCWFEADTPYVCTLANEQNFVSPYVTIANAIFSNTLHKYEQTTFLAYTSTAMVLTGLADAHFDKCEWAIGTGNTYPYAITMRSSAQSYQDCQDIRFTGQVETWTNAFRCEGNTKNIEFAVSTSSVTGAHVFSLVATHTNPTFKTNPLNVPGVNMLQASGGTVTINGGRLALYPGMTQADANVQFIGTDIDGGQATMNSPAVFTCTAGSSYSMRWQFAQTHYSSAQTPAGIASLGTFAATFAAAGVALGDQVTPIWPYSSQGCALNAAPDSAGNIKMIIQNMTGGTVTFGAGTFKFIVNRPTF